MIRLPHIETGFLRASCTYRATLGAGLDDDSAQEICLIEFDVDSTGLVSATRAVQGQELAEPTDARDEIVELYNVTLGRAIDPRGSDLLAAINSDDMEQIRALIAEGVALDINMHQGASLLHVAATRSLPLVVKELLDAGANPNATDDPGWTPLLIAAMQSDVETVQYLLNAGVDTEVRFQNATALEMAVARNDVSVIEVLESNAAQEPAVAVTEDAQPGVFDAARNGDLVRLKELVEQTPTAINQIDAHGNSPLNVAAASGQFDVATYLLSRSASVDVSNNAQGTALTAACQLGDLKIVELLLDVGANVEHPASSGVTPLLTAAQKRNLPLLEFLLDRGASVNSAATNGDTALHIAVRGDEYEMAEAVIARGANVTSKNARNSTPLSIAYSKGLSDFVRLLLRNGAGSGVWTKRSDEDLQLDEADSTTETENEVGFENTHFAEMGEHLTDLDDPLDDSYAFLDIVYSIENIIRPTTQGAHAQTPIPSSIAIAEEEEEGKPSLTDSALRRLVLAHCQECGEPLHSHDMRTRDAKDIVVFFCARCSPDGESPSQSFLDALQHAAANRNTAPESQRTEQYIEIATTCARRYLKILLGLVGEGELGSDWGLLTKKVVAHLKRERDVLLHDPMSDTYHPEIYRIRRLVYEGMYKKRFLMKPEEYHTKKVRLLRVAFEHLTVFLHELAPHHPDVRSFTVNTKGHLELVKKLDAEHRNSSS